MLPSEQTAQEMKLIQSEITRLQITLEKLEEKLEGQREKEIECMFGSEYESGIDY